MRSSQSKILLSTLLTMFVMGLLLVVVFSSQIKNATAESAPGSFVGWKDLSDADIRSTGLWGTGYGSDGRLLGAGGNETDGHWSVICSRSPFGAGGHSNQWAYDQNNTVRVLPVCANDISSMKTNYQAVTIYQNNRAAGRYSCYGIGSHIVGDIGFCPYGDIDGPWKRVGNNARWIGLSYYGLHTDDSSGRDPSIGKCGGTIQEIYNCGNMYVFRLENIKFKDIDKASKIKITMNGAVDNLAKIQINGVDAVMSGSHGGASAAVYNNYVMPGWVDSSSMSADFSGSVLESIKNNQKNGKANTLEVRIISDHSFVGLLIEKVGISYYFDHDYSINPTLNVAHKDKVELTDEKVSGIGGWFTNDGVTKTKDNTKHYAIARYVIKNSQGYTAPKKGDGKVGDINSENWPCQVVGAIAGIGPAQHCKPNIVKGKNNSEIGPSRSVSMTLDGVRVDDDITGIDLQIGDKICYVAMVGAYTGNVSENVFRHSDVQCIDVSKKPKVQVWGGDIKTNDSIRTTQTESVSAILGAYGSWGEYGLIAGDKIASASGAGLSSSFTGRVGVISYNKLTFANTPSFGSFSDNLVHGRFTAPRISPKHGRLVGSVNVNALESGEYTAGNITIAGNLSEGKSIVIRSTGTVTITGDVHYAATPDIARLPQLIIQAKNIVIDKNVEQVNAWLLTDNDGYVSTCGAVINMTFWLSGVSPDECSKKLTINGPIMAGHLFLRRTYGGQHSSAAKNDKNMHPGTPAEIINLRADVYLWAYNYYRSNGVIRTMNLKELPPRY